MNRKLVHSTKLISVEHDDASSAVTAEIESIHLRNYSDDGGAAASREF